ncbi:MAG TPA: hypothetical protein PKA64_23495 [Myxococcota bacterium]|nr:hypothetical protein [Myxococcota bacterium]
MGLRSLVAALALLVSPLARAEAPTRAPSEKVYWADGWSYCDVHLLARAWGISEAEAGARMISKLGSGMEDAVQSALQEQRPAIEPTGFAVCPYWEAGYSYEDAEALASYWGVEIYDAKARIELKLIWRNEGILSDELKAAGAYSSGSDVDPVGMTAFLKSPYTSCDAELVAAAWGTELESTKAMLGSKIVSGYGSLAKKEVKRARKERMGDTSLCAFWTLPLTYEDAEVLASAWGVDVSEAKTRVETAARAGKLSTVFKKLGSLMGE